MTGFWVRCRRPGRPATRSRSSAVCVVALAPLAVVGARTQSNYNQLADLDPRPAERRRRRGDPAAFRRGRAQPGRGPGRQPGSRLPVARRASGDRGDQPAARGRRSRGGSPLADPAGGPAARGPGRTGACSGGSPTCRCKSAPRPDTSASSRPTRPMPITSRASTSSSRPIPSPRPAWRPWIACTDRPGRRGAGQPLEGTRAVGLAGSTSAVNDLRRVTTSDSGGCTC